VLAGEFDNIPDARKKLLNELAQYVTSKRAKNLRVKLVYICTHNSRRSHFGQVWAKVASEYYKITEVETYSGGTEATTFNANAINALVRAGFTIETESAAANPVYHVHYAEDSPPIQCFSKVYDHRSNPSSDFAAVMTCGEADENCPFIPGAELRIATTYDDPKAFDHTPQEDAKYDERCRQIALETLYVFYKVT
jgi:arsenate reductase (thioredoxin)